MFGIHDFPVFLAAGIVLSLTPGPDTFYILGRSLGQGAMAGIASALGIASGLVVHTFLAALGLSTFLAASPTTFTIIRLAGAAYLVYLGWRMLWQHPQGAVSSACISRTGMLAIYRQGVLTNMLNPKIALFFSLFYRSSFRLQARKKARPFCCLACASSPPVPSGVSCLLFLPAACVVFWLLAQARPPESIRQPVY
jgi:threonine/homoserine/homoserine lactone efflux protein